MRINFRIHPALVPGEVYKLQFVNNGTAGTFMFLGMQKHFCIFENTNGELVRALYADVRSARG